MYFPQPIRESIVLMDKVYFFVHYHGAFGRGNIRSSHANNFGVLYYECTNSPFILYKTYLEFMCRIVYNIVDKKVLSLLVSNSESKCRLFTVCDHDNCLGAIKNRIKSVDFKETKKFSLRVIEISCEHIDPDFVNYDYMNY